MFRGQPVPGVFGVRAEDRVQAQLQLRNQRRGGGGGECSSLRLQNRRYMKDLDYNDLHNGNLVLNDGSNGVYIYTYIV